MSSHRRLFLALFLVIGAFAAIPPREIVWSTTSYGPDGPWQAVSVHLGTPLQAIDLCPGGFWTSNVLDTVICTSSIQTSFCYSRDAGLYNISASQTNAIYIEPGPKISQTLLSFQANCMAQFGTFEWMFDRLTLSDASQNPSTVVVESLDMIVFDEAYSYLPDGSPYPIQVGNLALGSPDFNQSWLSSLGGNTPHINGTFLPSYLFAKGYAESNSWSLHYGSASLGIPGSLYIGGYDRSRALGPITVGPVSNNFLPIDLLDIGIGVAEGYSPFNFSSKSGLLGQGNSSITGSLKVNVDATSPYLYLPKSTCDAIAENLPVTFQPKYGLYFWDTSNPRYEQIVSSPSFLSLAFRLNSSITQNLTVNIPFALLNLTLTPPLVTTPTQYFPCNPLSHPPPVTAYTYALGKAFLQAALIGVNWGPTGNGNWFLAQAPGPKTPTTPTPMAIGQTDRYILSSTTAWYDTWKGVLTPLTQDVQPNGPSANPSTSTSASTTAPANPNSSTSPSALPSSISVAAIAGIAIGAAILVIAAITTLFFIAHRRAKHGKIKAQAPSATVIETATSYPTPNPEDWKRNAGFPPREMNAVREPAELAVGIRGGRGGRGGGRGGRRPSWASSREIRYELAE